MKQLLCRFSIFFFTLVLSSCTREPSDSVDQDKIYVKYDLTYDKNEDVTKVKVEFHFGNVFGTKLELSNPASIKFNGNFIPYNSTLAYYEDEFPGFISSGTFTYKDVDGIIYTNSTETIKPVAFPVEEISITHRVDYVLNFTDEGIGSNDMVNVTIATKAFSTSISGATSLTLGGVQTNDISPGPYVANMYRTIVQSPSQATSEGGTIWLTYKAFNKAVTVH